MLGRSIRIAKIGTVIFAFAFIGIYVWRSLDEQGEPRTMSVAVIGYTNIGEVRHVIFVTTNVHSWPVELAVGMPEIRTATGWKDAWSGHYKYRTFYELDGGDTETFVYAVPTNTEPVRVRCLCYRVDSVGRKAWYSFVELIHGENPGGMPYPVYSEELSR
jgi:hypothetical protein